MLERKIKSKGLNPHIELIQYVEDGDLETEKRIIKEYNEKYGLLNTHIELCYTDMNIKRLNILRWNLDGKDIVNISILCNCSVSKITKYLKAKGESQLELNRIIDIASNYFIEKIKRRLKEIESLREDYENKQKSENKD